MTDDLVKRLREEEGRPLVEAAEEAAARIEQLEAALQRANATAHDYDLPIHKELPATEGPMILKIKEQHNRIKILEEALREKDNIAYVIDSHGISHDTFTIVYRAALGEKKNGNV